MYKRVVDMVRMRVLCIYVDKSIIQVMRRYKSVSFSCLPLADIFQFKSLSHEHRDSENYDCQKYLVFGILMSIHSCTCVCSLPHTPAHARSLPRVLMHAYRWEDKRSKKFQWRFPLAVIRQF